MVIGTANPLSSRFQIDRLPGALLKPALNGFELPTPRGLVKAEHPLALQAGIIDAHEARFREHPGISSETFVDHVDFIATLHRCKLGTLDQLADVVYPRIAGRVNFRDIQGRSPRNRATRLTPPTGLRCRPIAGQTIQ